MRNDPIIEEIHKIRERYAEKFGFDLDAMFADLKLKEKQNNLHMIVRKPKIFHKSSLSISTTDNS
jgi:uncharacterized membrane protein YfhO